MIEGNPNSPITNHGGQTSAESNDVPAKPPERVSPLRKQFEATQAANNAAKSNGVPAKPPERVSPLRKQFEATQAAINAAETTEE